MSSDPLLFNPLESWRNIIKQEYELKIEEETPCRFTKQEDLSNWQLQQKDCQDFQNWLPLIYYRNGIHDMVLYQNVNVQDEFYGNYKHLTRMCGSRTIKLVDYANKQEAVQRYNSLVLGVQLYN